MARNVTCGIDAFAKGIDELIGDLPAGCTDALERSTRTATRVTAQLLQGEYTQGIGLHPWSDEYRSGFSADVKRDVFEVEGEVGNRNKPGLVHLLEKGHATLTERRTRAYPHMAPAFDDMVEIFEEEVERELRWVL